MARLKNFSEYLLLAVIVIISVYARVPERVPPYLWLDEAWRAVAIEANSSLPGLVRYMSQTPAAVLPSEWALGRLGLLVFGKQELAFRYAPLLFSSITLLVAYALIRHVTRSRLAVLTPLLFGLAPLFIRHARQFKPYSLDLFMTVTTLWVATLFVSDPSKKRQLLLIVVLSVFSLTSLPALFVIPGIALYLVYHRITGLIRLAKIAGIPLALYALNYLFLLKPQSAGGALNYWNRYYLDDLSKIPFLARKLVVFVDSSSFLDWRVLIVSYFIILPVISLYKQDGFWILLITPLGIQAVMSSLSLYPLFDRPSIYLYGLILVSSVYSIAGIFEIFSKACLRQRYLRSSVGTLVIAGFLTTSMGTLQQDWEEFRSWPTYQGRESFQVLAENFSEGEWLRFSYGSYFTLKFYQDIALDGNKYLSEHLSEFPPHRGLGLNSKSAALLCDSLLDIDDPIEIGTRIWFLSSHNVNAYKYYQSVLPQVGDVQTYVAKPQEGLISVVLEKPLTSLDCSAF